MLLYCFKTKLNFKMFTKCIVLVCAFNFALCLPLKKKMIDLTYSFDDVNQRFPIFKNFEMTVTQNGTFEDTDLWIQAEEYSSSTHVGTHMDAPSHFVPGGKNIDDIPVENFIAPAAVIDITHLAAVDKDAGVTINHLLEWEHTTRESLNGTVILMRSGWGKYYRNNTAYYGNSEENHRQMHFPAFTAESVEWLVKNRRMVGMGVDTMSLDLGISTDSRCHKALLGNGGYILENLANLEELPIYGATLYVFPMKIAKASGAPTRVVATYPEVLFPHVNAMHESCEVF